MRLLSAIFAAGISVSACARDNQPRPAPDPSPIPAADEQEAQPQAQPPSQPAEGPQPTPAPGEQDPAGDAQIKHDGGNHDGGNKDVGAIGQRKVGGFDIYSIDTDVKIGRAYAQQIERTTKMVDDPVVNEYVNRIGQNLVRNSDAKFPFTIKIVEDDEINAMSLPGGFLYVNSGLILAADDEAELAGAMAHEIAHVALRHATRQMTRASIFQILSIPVVASGVPINPSVFMPVTFLKFSRGFEADADYFGLQYMYKAGYDPNSLVTFFEKLQALEKRKPNALSRAFATHPQTPDRVKKSQREIATILPARDHYVETTSEFNDVKARLVVLENRRKMDDANRNKPVLRRIATHVSERGASRRDDDRSTVPERDQ